MCMVGHGKVNSWPSWIPNCFAAGSNPMKTFVIRILWFRAWFLVCNKRIDKEQWIDAKKIIYKMLNRTIKLWVEQTDKSNPFHKCLHVTQAFK